MQTRGAAGTVCHLDSVLKVSFGLVAVFSFSLSKSAALTPLSVSTRKGKGGNSLRGGRMSRLGVWEMTEVR